MPDRSPQAGLLGLLIPLLFACPESPDNLPDGSPVVDGQPFGAGSGGDNSSLSPVPPEEHGTVQFDLNPGTGVKLSGTLSYAGEQVGPLLLQVVILQPNQPPELKHSQVQAEFGEFEVEVPRHLGKTTLVSFVDVENDGPSETDPAAFLSLEIGSREKTGLIMELSDAPDMGLLTPGDRSTAAGPPLTTTEESE